MTRRRETNGVGIPISPREGLDVVRIADLRAQYRAVADARANLTRKGVEEGRYRGPRLLNSEGGIPARRHSVARAEDVLAERDVLARDIGLILAAAIVETDDAAVGRRPLRPVDPPVPPECQLLGWVVTPSAGW